MDFIRRSDEFDVLVASDIVGDANAEVVISGLRDRLNSIADGVDGGIGDPRVGSRFVLDSTDW